MAKLSADEQAALKALQEKAKAPERSSSQHTLNVSIDLGDPEQVKRAQKLGFLDAFEDEPEDETDPDPEPDPDEVPKRRGFFPDE